jgi:hypothetical protein
MTTAGGSRGERILVVAAGLTAVAAAYLWFAPFVVPARDGLPFGCGSPAHPNLRGVAGQVCGPALDGRRTATAAVAVLTGVLVVLAVAAASRLGARMRRRGTLVGFCLGAALGLGAVTAAVVVLLAPLQARSADGATVVGCGSPLKPSADGFAQGLCADLPANRLAAGIALAGAGLVLLLAVGWAVAPAAVGVSDVDAEADVDVIDVDRASGIEEPAEPARLLPPDPVDAGEPVDAAVDVIDVDAVAADGDAPAAHSAPDDAAHAPAGSP